MLDVSGDEQELHRDQQRHGEALGKLRQHARHDQRAGADDEVAEGQRQEACARHQEPLSQPPPSARTSATLLWYCAERTCSPWRRFRSSLLCPPTTSSRLTHPRPSL